MRKSNWRNAPGPGDLWQPPDDYDEPEPEPEPETVYRFRRPRIINGKLYAEFRAVDVDAETHKVIRYLRTVNRLCWHHFTHGAEIRKWAAKHPRVGPRYIAALEAL